MIEILDSLLSKGERVVVTGLSRSGKSTAISHFTPKYNTFRDGSWWNTQWITSKEFYKSYLLFDRCNWIDRYAFLRHTNSSLELAVKEFVEAHEGVYIVLSMNDQFRTDFTDFDNTRRTEVATRYIEIVQAIYATGKIKGVIILTCKGWRSTDFWKGEDFFSKSLDEITNSNMGGNIAMEAVDKDKLSILIKAANNYYNGRDTGLTDFEYDYLMDYAKNHIKGFDIFDYVQYDEGGEGDYPHSIKIPVFEKKNYKDFEVIPQIPDDWVLTPKNDGCSIVAYYDAEGKLLNILTRSNELSGKLQTEKLRNKVPNSVNPSIKAILFEAVVSTNRSKANGLINSKYKQDEVDALLDLRPFDCVLRDRKLGYIDRMNLIGVPYCVLTPQQARSLRGQGDEPKLIDNGKEVPVDGIVVYSSVYPDFGMIYKFYTTEGVKTKVTSVNYKRSDETGLITITLGLEPVKIGPITVKNIGNAGNWSTINEKKLGVGSEVKVQLAKLTIPQIKEVLTERTEEPVPICPSCGHKLEPFQGKLICPNLDCEGWEDYFTTRYFNVLKERYNKEWVDEFTVNGKFGIDMMVRAEIKTKLTLFSFLMIPDYMFYFLKPPKIGGKNYDLSLKTAKGYWYSYKPTKLSEGARAIIDSVSSSNQKEYCEMAWTKLLYFVKKALLIRRDYEKGRKRLD